MTYKNIKDLKPSEFKRLCGVRPETFQAMVEVLQPILHRTGKRGGQTKLSTEDQLLLALQYWREYRTYFHIAQSWGVHESTACRIVHKIERHLVQSQRFRLPTRQALMSNVQMEVVVVDVTEVPIERPKKSKEATTVGNKNVTP
jgi:hypothetical protein